MEKKPSAIIYHDTRRPKTNGLFPVKIRVTYMRKSKYYPCHVDLSADSFKKIMLGKKLSVSDNNTAGKIRAYESKANTIISKLSVFTWSIFESQFLSNRGLHNGVFDAFDETIENMRAKGAIGTAVTYECAKKSLQNFKPALSFADITSELLTRYETEMLKAGNSFTTISIYTRALRAIFNSAIDSGLVSRDAYPFGEKGYKVPETRNVKKALTLEEIGKLYATETAEKPVRDKMKDLWFFMYFSNGMNVKDLCLLRNKNIGRDFISYMRAKTLRSSREKIEIRIPINSDIRRILDKWKVKSKDPEAFVFGYLTDKTTAERQRQVIQQLTHLINDHMRELAKAAGIEQTITSYSARHSFATVLKRSGASTEFISESLGHSNLKTTKHYLDSFEDDHKKKVAEALEGFKASTKNLKAV